MCDVNNPDFLMALLLVFACGSWIGCCIGLWFYPMNPPIE